MIAFIYLEYSIFIFLQIVFIKWVFVKCEKNQKAPGTYIKMIKQKCYKVYKDSTYNKQETQKDKKQKSSKRIGRKCRLLKKIITI